MSLRIWSYLSLSGWENVTVTRCLVKNTPGLLLKTTLTTAQMSPQPVFRSGWVSTVTLSAHSRHVHLSNPLFGRTGCYRRKNTWWKCPCDACVSSLTLQCKKKKNKKNIPDRVWSDVWWKQEESNCALPVSVSNKSPTKSFYWKCSKYVFGSYVNNVLKPTWALCHLLIGSQNVIDFWYNCN